MSYFWRWLVFGLLAGSLVLAASCGDDDDTEEAAEEEATEAEEEAEATEPVDEATEPEEAAEEEAEGLDGESVDVLGIWGAEEIDDFDAMYSPWQDETGASVQFTGDRDINTILTTRVEGGDPPDMALPASVGIFRDLAAGGALTPLDECFDTSALVDVYPQSVIDLGTVDGQLYGIFMKAGNKATVWYSPPAFEAGGYAVPETFDDMLALADQIVEAGGAPFSNAEEAGAGTGFPGSDWIQQIFLHMHGPELYDQWVDGSLPYSAPEVREAWELFGQVVLTDGYLLGGPEQALATPFSEGSVPLFGDPPEAYMHYLGSFNAGFITDTALGFPEGLEPGTDFNYFAFPSINEEYAGGVTGDANVMMIFNSDPATCSLAEWLASGESQQIWVERGGFTSFNSEVDLAAYPTDLDRQVAEQLTSEDTIFRFDADDAMPTGVGAAVFQGVIAYMQGGDLDEILADIEAAFPEGAGDGAASEDAEETEDGEDEEPTEEATEAESG